MTVRTKGVLHQLVAVPVARLARGVVTVPITLLAADKPPTAAAVGGVSQLLDVDMDERARVIMLVSADRFPGRPIDMAQPVQPGRGQDPVDCRGRDASSGGELDRPLAQPQPQRHHPRSDPVRGFVRAMVWPRGTIRHRLPTGIPASPTLDRGPRALEPGRDFTDRITPVDDELGDPQTGARSQGCVSAGHKRALLG